MKKNLTPKAILIPTVSLFLICLVVTALLALTNSITADKIAENERQNQQNSMQTVLPDAKSFDPVDLSSFGVSGDDLPDAMYLAKDAAGNPIGYAISTSAQGYGGKVKVMTGVGMDGVITGVDVFYNDDETPGLGKNSSNESFRVQYKGLSAGLPIFVSKDNTDPSAQEIDALTSATISSRAVTKAVNAACRAYTQYTAKEAK